MTVGVQLVYAFADGRSLTVLLGELGDPAMRLVLCKLIEKHGTAVILAP